LRPRGKWRQPMTQALNADYRRAPLLPDKIFGGMGEKGELSAIARTKFLGGSTRTRKGESKEYRSEGILRGGLPN